MKSIIILITLFAFPLMASERSCQVEIKEQNLCAELTWSEGPHWGRFSTAELRYWKKDDAKQTLVDPTSELVPFVWMIMEGGMEHGGRTPVITHKAAGHFQIEKLQFMKMGKGLWELRLRKVGGSERKDIEGIFKIDLVP